MAQIQSETKLRGLRDVFDGLSFSQVTAGALAAATSMLLASNVGIAGTVIGVAVSSVVSAVASQVYKKFLIASAEKVKDLAPVGLGHHAVSPGRSASEDEGEPSVSSEPRDAAAFGAVSARRAALSRRFSRVGRNGYGEVSMGEAYADAALLKARIARERKARIQRNTIIVAVLSAIIAVVVCALTIDVATQGKGLGPQMPTATYIQARNTANSEEDEAVAEEEEAEDAAQDVASSVREGTVLDAQKKEEGKAEGIAPPVAGGTGSSGGSKAEAPDESEGAEADALPPDSEDDSEQSLNSSGSTGSSGGGSLNSSSSSHSGSSATNGSSSGSGQKNG